MALNNLDIEVEGDLIQITADSSQPGIESQSGKTIVVAKTGKAEKVETPNGDMYVQVTIYRYP